MVYLLYQTWLISDLTRREKKGGIPRPKFFSVWCFFFTFSDIFGAIVFKIIISKKGPKKIAQPFFFLFPQGPNFPSDCPDHYSGPVQILTVVELDSAFIFWIRPPRRHLRGQGPTSGQFFKTVLIYKLVMSLSSILMVIYKSNLIFL